MDKGTLQTYIGVALKHREIRKTVAAVERLRSAISLLDQVPPEALESLRDHVHNDSMLSFDLAEKEFNKCYLCLVEHVIATKKLRQRDLYRGITGEDR